MRTGAEMADAVSSMPVLAAVVVVVLGGVLWARSRAWRKDKARGEALLRRGDLDGAAAVFEAARRKVSRSSLKEAHAQLGWVELRRGRLDRAIALFRAADEGPDPTVSTNETKLRIAQGLARAYALAGDAETASAWHARARKLVAPGHEVHLVFEELLIALRRGDFAGAEARAAEAWPAIETTHTGEAIRDLRVLRAFGEANRGESGRPGPHIEAARANRTGAHDWMAVKWPELGAFLRGNNL